MIERRQAVLLGHGVEVVEHEDHRLSVPAEGAQQLVDGVLDRAPCGAEPTQRRLAEARANPIDRRRDVAPHPAGVVVAGVEGDPGQRSIPGRAPDPDRRRLPVARRRPDERQHGVGVERVQDARAVEDAAPHARRRELCLHERRRLRLGSDCLPCVVRFGGHLQPILPGRRVEAHRTPVVQSNTLGEAPDCWTKRNHLGDSPAIAGELKRAGAMLEAWLIGKEGQSTLPQDSTRRAPCGGESDSAASCCT